MKRADGGEGKVFRGRKKRPRGEMCVPPKESHSFLPWGYAELQYQVPTPLRLPPPPQFFLWSFSFSLLLSYPPLPLVRLSMTMERNHEKGFLASSNVLQLQRTWKWLSPKKMKPIGRSCWRREVVPIKKEQRKSGWLDSGLVRSSASRKMWLLEEKEASEDFRPLSHCPLLKGTKWQRHLKEKENGGNRTSPFSPRISDRKKKTLLGSDSKVCAWSWRTFILQLTRIPSPSCSFQ